MRMEGREMRKGRCRLQRGGCEVERGVKRVRRGCCTTTYVRMIESLVNEKRRVRPITNSTKSSESSNFPGIKYVGMIANSSICNDRGGDGEEGVQHLH